jgi:hypothetical protein
VGLDLDDKDDDDGITGCWDAEADETAGSNPEVGAVDVDCCCCCCCIAVLLEITSKNVGTGNK